jgi:hypothetical protein
VQPILRRSARHHAEDRQGAQRRDPEFEGTELLRSETGGGNTESGTLNPYERSKVEQVLFAVSEREGKPAAAREHLLEALAAGGLSPQEAYNVLDQLRVLGAELESSAP